MFTREEIQKLSEARHVQSSVNTKQGRLKLVEEKSKEINILIQKELEKTIREKILRAKKDMKSGKCLRKSILIDRSYVAMDVIKRIKRAGTLPRELTNRSWEMEALLSRKATKQINKIFKVLNNHGFKTKRPNKLYTSTFYILLLQDHKNENAGLSKVNKSFNIDISSLQDIKDKAKSIEKAIKNTMSNEGQKIKQKHLSILKEYIETDVKDKILKRIKNPDARINIFKDQAQDAAWNLSNGRSIVWRCYETEDFKEKRKEITKILKEYKKLGIPCPVQKSNINKMVNQTFKQAQEALKKHGFSSTLDHWRLSIDLVNQEEGENDRTDD